MTSIDRPFDSFMLGVFAQPDDDEWRMVYGDWLIARGDPRGELIQLQLDPPWRQDATRSARVRELLRDRVEQWCDPLFPALDPQSIEFERGFLWRCRTLDRTPALSEVVLSPVWHTVGDLETTDEHLIANVSLRSVRTLRTSVLGLAAVERENRIERVVLRDTEVGEPSRFRGEDPRLEPAWARIGDVGALGNVRELVIEGRIDAYSRRARALLDSALGRRLETLEYQAEREQPAVWVSWLADHPLRRLVLHFTDRARIAFERDERGKLQPLVELDGPGSHEEVRDAALSLVSSCPRIAIAAGEYRDQLAPIVDELRALFDHVVVR